MKRLGIALVALLIALVAGYRIMARESNRANSPVLTLYGNVDIRTVNLGFRVGGRLARLECDEGATVHAGDVLGRLDPEPLEREMAEGQANVASLRARLSLLEAGYRPEEIAQARATVDERKATLANAERIVTRETGLRGSGATAEKNYDDAVAARDEAAARLKLAEQSLRVFESGYRAEEIAQARADLARGEALLAQTQLKLQDATLTAPADGIILTRAVEPGAIVGEGTTVFSLSVLNPVWVRAYVNETDLGRLHPGSEVKVFSDTYPDHGYKGHVGFISPTAEFTPKNVETPELRTGLVYRLRIIIDQPDTTLRQGMPVTAELRTNGPAVVTN